MPKLRALSAKKLISIFQRLGFVIVSQKGSHIKMSRNSQTLVIPNHSSIAKGTLKEIYNQACEYVSEVELKDIFYA